MSGKGKTLRLVCLPGDGIGPEVMDSALGVLRWAADQASLRIETQSSLFGGSSIDRHGVPLTEETLQFCREADAVLLGAVGGPKWDSLPQERKPEAGLLRLRGELGLYCNLRPAVAVEPLLDSSPLKERVVHGTDLVVVRELTGGIYFGKPRGASREEGWNTDRYSREEVARIAHSAFRLAQGRSRRVVSVDKANVLEVSRFWREVVEEIHAEYPDVELSHLYVDNAAMQLVRNPRGFDVVLTSNLFGDILSDLAGALTGSLGMLPSASLGDKHALYEPIHGTAPDIAGKDIANPLGMIGSLAMCLRHTLGLPALADRIETGIIETLVRGFRTPDIAGPLADRKSGIQMVGTRELTRRLVETMERKPPHVQ